VLTRPIAPAALALALAAPLLLGACGGGGHETPSEPPTELLRQAVAAPAPSGEAGIELDAQLEGDTLLAGATTVDLDGPFALADAGLAEFDLAYDAEVAGFGVDGELVSTGDDAFVVFFGENYRVGPARVAQIEGRLEARGGGLGLDLVSWFRDPRYAGEEEVAGTATERIEATLDGAAAGRDIAALARALGAPPLVGALAAGAGEGPAEAWVAYDDDTIRRIRVQFPFTVPPAQRLAARGITGGVVDLEAEISDVGAEVEVEPPPGGGFQPIEQLTRRLADLASLGGL
jgi:hypothetical protein